jgi:hypothetical protein
LTCSGSRRRRLCSHKTTPASRQTRANRGL